MGRKQEPKLYAVTYRFHEPQPDGSVGVVILNKRHGWKPSRDERKYIDDICDECVRDIENDEIVRGQATFLWDKKPRQADLRLYKKLSDSPEALHAWADDRFTIGLWLIDTTHAQHPTVQ